MANYTKTLLVGKAGMSRNQKVVLEVALQEIRWDKTELTISGYCWNHLGTDISQGGQILEEIPELIENWVMEWSRFKRIRQVWRRWHLNALRPGCEHQYALGWTPKNHLNESCPTCDYKFGTKWLYEPLPQEIIDEVQSW